MALELQPLPGQPGLFRRQQGLGQFTIPGTFAASLINRRQVLRENWMKLRSQLAPGLGAPPAGISRELNDAAMAAFNAFITWDDSIGTLKEIGGTYEAEVAQQEAIYDMYSGQVARALQSVGKHPSFPAGIPRAGAPAPEPKPEPEPAPVNHASASPYPLPEPSKWGTVDWILASVAALSLVYILVDLGRAPTWQDEGEDLPEVKPPKRGRFLPSAEEEPAL